MKKNFPCEICRSRETTKPRAAFREKTIERKLKIKYLCDSCHDDYCNSLLAVLRGNRSKINPGFGLTGE